MHLTELLIKSYGASLKTDLKRHIKRNPVVDQKGENSKPAHILDRAAAILLEDIIMSITQKPLIWMLSCKPRPNENNNVYSANFMGLE